MINKLKILLTALLLASSFIFVAAASAYNPLCPTVDKSSGDCTSGACKNNDKTPLCQQAKAQDTKPSNPIAGPGGVINKAANIVAVITAIGAVIMILIGAFEFVTAGGTGFKSAVAGAAPTKVAKARSRIASGLIGLVVVALAWAIVRLITDRVIR